MRLSDIPLALCWCNSRWSASNVYRTRIKPIKGYRSWHVGKQSITVPIRNETALMDDNTFQRDS